MTSSLHLPVFQLFPGTRTFLAEVLPKRRHFLIIHLEDDFWTRLKNNNCLSCEDEVLTMMSN